MKPRDQKKVTEEKILSQAKIQLIFTKKQARELIEAHNQVTTLIWKIDLALDKLRKQAEENPDKLKNNNEVKFLEEKRKLLTDILEKTNSHELIKQKFAEIEKLEKIIDPNKKIDFNSPYQL